MICKACAKAADRDIYRWHGECPGDTWCDCCHQCLHCKTRWPDMVHHHVSPRRVERDGLVYSYPPLGAPVADVHLPDNGEVVHE